MSPPICLFNGKDFKKWIVEKLFELGEQISLIHGKGETIMATLQEITDKLAAIPPVLDAIVADEQGLRDQIAALQAQIAAGGTITEAQLDPILAQADAVLARLQAIDAAV
mgnify:CR=1 FL=1